MSRLFTCPVCGEPLTREPARYVCPKNHSFDCSAQGYVHLLPADKMRAKLPGDSPEMVRARRDFLASESYGFLAEAIAQALSSRLQGDCVLFDAGCGEGYYTRRIWELLSEKGLAVFPTGVDIAKAAVKMTAKKLKNGEFAVASLYRLPVRDCAVDGVMNIFSPLCVEETRRVLKPGGVFLYVVPAARHLYEMKEILYENPYENEEKRTPYEGFLYDTVIRAEKRLSLSGDTLRSLFAMTPYFWRSPREGAERLNQTERLDVTASFDIHIFRKQ